MLRGFPPPRRSSPHPAPQPKELSWTSLHPVRSCLRNPPPCTVLNGIPTGPEPLSAAEDCPCAHTESSESTTMSNEVIILSDSVIDFRIQVIRSSRKYDSLLLVFFRVSKSLLFPRFQHRHLNACCSSLAACTALFNLCLADTPYVCKNFIQFSASRRSSLSYGTNGCEKFHAVFRENIVHIVCDNFRIGSNNRAVIMVLCTFRLPSCS